MQEFRRTRRRRTTTLPEITLTPLIDTALTLLIIFMVTAPMINNAIRVELPKGKAKEDGGKQQEMIVFIDQNSKTYLNGNAVKNDDDLIVKIKEMVGTSKDRTVCVKADQSVNYGKVIELVDHIKVVGGVAYVVLATKRV